MSPVCRAAVAVEAATLVVALILVSGADAKQATGGSSQYMVSLTQTLKPNPQPPVAPFPEEFYGYIPQNPEYNSNFFYAIRGNPNATFRQNAPLVMFLQGGPGATSLFSDFLETGPKKLILSNTSWGGFSVVDREHAWTNHANMLYVDNPIGTGFSYTVDPRGFSTSDENIADNLVDFLQKFFLKHTEYASSPFWIFCESYGGKMTAYFGAALVKAIEQGSISVNFKGVALGDGWVDPVDCMYSYASYLTTFSQINPAQAANISAMAAFAENALEEGNGSKATEWWGTQQDVISFDTDGINWYNSLYYYDYTADNQLNTFLSVNFTEKLGPIVPNGVVFGAQSDEVFGKMSDSFMRDGIDQVAKILKAGYQVNIYTGQVDLIVDVVCMNSWVSKLNWPYLEEFYAQPRLPLQLPNDPNAGGFVQSYQNLTIWNINKAGHMVPLDNPPYAELMMASIVQSEKVGSIRVAPEDVAAQQHTIHMRRPQGEAKTRRQWRLV